MHAWPQFLQEFEARYPRRLHESPVSIGFGGIACMLGALPFVVVGDLLGREIFKIGIFCLLIVAPVAWVGWGLISTLLYTFRARRAYREYAASFSPGLRQACRMQAIDEDTQQLLK